MSTRHNNFTILFSGEGYDGTICKYREGLQWDEIKSVICDAWGPARFNYECHGMSLPVNSQQAFSQFIERLHRGEVETCVTEINGSTYPVLRCLLLPHVVGGAGRQPYERGGGGAMMLRPVKPRAARAADDTALEMQEDPAAASAGDSSSIHQQKRFSAGGSSSNISRMREGGYHAAGPSSSSSSSPVPPIPDVPSRTSINNPVVSATAAAGTQQNASYHRGPVNNNNNNNQQQQESHTPRDDLDSTQKLQQQPRSKSSSRPQSAAATRASTNNNNNNNSQQPQQQEQLSAAGVLDAAAASQDNSQNDTCVCAIRTRVPPVCVQVRIDQGGLIGNLRAHIQDVAARNAQIELPTDFVLGFSRPDCESSIDVEDDGDFNFLKASIKRMGPEAIVLFADVKKGAHAVVGNAADFGSPLKPNPFAGAKSGAAGTSPKRDPMNDAARHLL